MRLALSQLSGAELGVLSLENQEPWTEIRNLNGIYPTIMPIWNGLYHLFIVKLRLVHYVVSHITCKVQSIET
jgi:hypothetical protein